MRVPCGFRAATTTDTLALRCVVAPSRIFQGLRLAAAPLSTNRDDALVERVSGTPVVVLSSRQGKACSNISGCPTLPSVPAPAVPGRASDVFVVTSTAQLLVKIAILRPPATSSSLHFIDKRLWDYRPIDSQENIAGQSGRHIQICVASRRA